MATCKQTAHEMIHDLFSPFIAVVCGKDVDSICAKNNLSFVEMVQPFCRINTGISVRDPSNIPCSIRNFRVVMKDMYCHSPSLPVGKKMMHDAVSGNLPPGGDGVLCNSINTDNYQLKFHSATPWFEAYRDVFFQVISPTEHEFVHHFLGCIFVVSSSHHDPLSQINDLAQQQALHQQQNSSHSTQWFFSYVFKYYLLLHDVSSEDLAKAEAIYQSMKSSYGSSSCHLLQINSICRTEGNGNQHEEMNGISNMPDPWSQFLSRYNLPQDDAISSKPVSENNYDFLQQNEDVQDAHCDGPSLNDTDKTNFISHPLLCDSEEDSAVNDSVIGNIGDDTRTSSFGPGKGIKYSNRGKRHGLCLTASDMDRIRVFVQDFCFQGLIPFVEKQIRILSDQVANRKGLHRTIFGVTKKIFGGNKPGSQSPASSANSVVYSQDAPELQVRKLGDLAFMFQLYEVAYQAYYTARRDFGSDQAWLYAAGASEMAALAVFMQGNTSPHEYPARYMESAITSYLLSCKQPELATRATLLSTECLKAKGLYKEAAVQFIRMPSEADLPSALFLEQAAHCYINCKPPKVRKYAFHIILAGHRFSKAGQRKHALRAYKQAEQVYEDRGWNFANDHINFTAGRLSVYLKQLDSACMAFKSLLATQSQQPPVEQASFLREYLYVLKQLLSQRTPSENYELPCLPVPVINCQATKVLLGEDNIITEDGSLFVKGRGFERADVNNSVWARLEEIVIVGAQKCLPPLHSPQLQCLTSNTDNSSQPLAVVKEVITVEIVLKNPLGVSITIDNIFLLWTFMYKSESNEDLSCISNELEFIKATALNTVVETEVIPHFVLEPRQEKLIHLILRPQVTGELVVNGLAYSLLSQMNYSQSTAISNGAIDVPSSQRSSSVLSLQGKQVIELKGPRLNRTTAEKTSKIYAADHRLRFHIISSMPKLQVKYQSFPCHLFCGEIQQVNVELCNIGENILSRVIVASPTPGLFAIGGLDSELDNQWQVYKEVPCNKEPLPVMAEWECYDWKFEVQMPECGPCRLHPGESINLPMWIRGPDNPGEHNLDLLFYYEAEPLHPKLRHRLLQHSSVLIAYPSVSVSANAMMSFCFEEKLASRNPGSSANSILLSVEASNINEELSSISISQVSCVSQDWCLCSTDDNVKKGMPVIHPREMLHIILKAIGFNAKSTVSSQKINVFSHVSMSSVEVDSSTTPCSDFSCRSMLNLPDLLSIESVQNSASSKAPEAGRDQTLILLLTVIWKAKVQRNGENRIITGQHHIPIKQFVYSASPNLSIAQPVKETVASAIMDSEIPNPAVVAATAYVDPLAVGSSVKCVLSHPFHVQHNFKHKRLVTVPVEFLAHTTSQTEIQILLDCTSVLVDDQANNPDDPESQMPHNFSWVSSSRRVIQVKPYNMVRVPLLAAFSSPGTYNLGSLCVTVMDSQGEVMSPYIMSPYIIVVSSCDSPPR